MSVKDLIETNLRQRRDISSSSLKIGRIICELERIYGVRQGSSNPKGINQHFGDPTMSDDKIFVAEIMVVRETS